MGERRGRPSGRRGAAGFGQALLSWRGPLCCGHQLTVLGVHVGGGPTHLRSSLQTSPGAQLPAYSGSPHVIVPPQPSGKLPHSTPAGHVVAGTHCSLLSATHLERSSAQTWSVGQSGPHSMVTPH